MHIGGRLMRWVVNALRTSPFYAVLDLWLSSIHFGHWHTKHNQLPVYWYRSALPEQLKDVIFCLFNTGAHPAAHQAPALHEQDRYGRHQLAAGPQQGLRVSVPAVSQGANAVSSLFL